MNIFDFSKVEENKFITIIDRKIRIYENYNIIFPREEHYLDDMSVFFIASISFSYDDNYIIIQDGAGTIYIVSYDNLIMNRRSFIFKFDTDYMPVKYFLSPNRNQIAILFNMSSNCYYRFEDRGENINIENPYGNNQLVQMVHVYDFTPGISRLIFNKYFQGHISDISLSEYDTLAIIGTINIDGNNYGLNIFDLETGNLILYNSRPGSIKIISFFPNSEENDVTRKILLISNELDSTFNNLAIRRLDNFEIIEELSILEDITINCAFIKENGEITIGSENGLVFFNFNGQPLQHRNKFQGYNIKNISYSLLGNIIGITIADVDNEDPYIFRTYFKLFDLETNQYLSYEGEDEEYENEDEYEEEDEEEDDELEFYDSELTSCTVPPSNQEKFAEFSSQTCFDLIQLNEENIGNYLSSNQDNIVIFYKEPSDTGFSATCHTFTGLRKYLKDPMMLFYACIEGKNFTTYHHDIPQYVKIPTQGGNLFLIYNDIKQKYIQRQNMIFLEYSNTVTETISYDASIHMNFVSGNHCQEGSSIRIYRIIF